MNFNSVILSEGIQPIKHCLMDAQIIYQHLLEATPNISKPRLSSNWGEN